MICVPHMLGKGDSPVCVCDHPCSGVFYLPSAIGTLGVHFEGVVIINSFKHTYPHWKGQEELKTPAQF